MWNLKREEQLVLLFLICAFTIGLGIKLLGGIPTPPSSTPSLIKIKIYGAVKKPGWYEVPEGSSLKELIQREGDILLPWADLSKMNLSSPISSNTVYIPEGKLNLNQARVEDLTYLPGIGPELARRIVIYREKVGGFKRLSQLKEVPGIGEVRFQKIKKRLTIKDK